MHRDDAAYQKWREHPCDETLAELYGAVTEHVRRATIRILGLTDPQLVPDTTSRIMASVSAFRPDAKFSTWVHRVALNRIYSYLDLRYRENDQASLADAPELPTSDDTVLRLDLEERMEGLEPLDRVILMWKLQGETGAEIARRLGIGERTVDKYSQRTRRILQEA